MAGDFTVTLSQNINFQVIYRKWVYNLFIFISFGGRSICFSRASWILGWKVYKILMFYQNFLAFNLFTALFSPLICRELDISQKIQRYCTLFNLMLDQVHTPLNSSRSFPILLYIVMSERANQRSINEYRIQKNEKTEKPSQLHQSAKFQSQAQNYLEPPRDIASKSYSLAPDMIGGWKPRAQTNRKNQIIVPITYEDEKRDFMLKCLNKVKKQGKERLIYVGPHYMNSYELHEDRNYPNPHKKQKHLNQLQDNLQKPKDSKSKILKNTSYFTQTLHFDSDFQGGNLDLVIQKENLQFDLFMRVDTNTRGHTNWYFFQVHNMCYQGIVHFNICNFRRNTSLYQQGAKPYVLSQKQGGDWRQQGKNIVYTRSKLKYSFLPNQQEDSIFSKYFVLSFDYQFKYQQDKVKFAYCVPYVYTQLLDFVQNLKEVQRLPSLKSLSGLDIPVLKITDQKASESKKVALITARVHPGQSNSSYIMQGFLNTLCNKTSVLSTELRQKYIFYVIPMINPDGVVAGNYRTSLFGKDLNRTYNQSRRYAFPETYYIVEMALKLKSEYNNRFCLFIDLHGHSSKKNLFTYGPQFSIQTTNYELCRQLPKIMSNLTSYFRFYSCSFRISNQKESTARGIFNKVLNIPFTYTLETSNGLFLDIDTQTHAYGNKSIWREIGFLLCKALNTVTLEKRKLIKRILTQQVRERAITEVEQKLIVQDNNSKTDEDSDADPIEEDLPEQYLMKLQTSLAEHGSQKGKLMKNKGFFRQEKSISVNQPRRIQKNIQKKLGGDQLKKQKDMNRQLIKNTLSRKNKVLVLPPVQLNNNEIFLARKKRSQQQFERSQQEIKNIPMTSELKAPLLKKIGPTIFIHEVVQTHLNKISRSRSMGKPESNIQTFLQKFKTIK